MFHILKQTCKPSYWPILTEVARASEELLINRTEQVDVCCWLIRCSWILISPCTSCLIVIGSAYMNERKLFGWFHVVIATSFGSAAWMNFLLEGWQRGGSRAAVFVRVCVFFYVLGDGGGSFCRCNSSSQRFPTLLFSTDVRLCSCVSSHVVISAPFWRCGPTTQQYFPPQSMPEPLLIPSLRFLLLRVGLHVAMFSFQTLYVHAKKPSLPTRRADDGLKRTRCFLGVMSHMPIWTIIYQHQCF